MSGGRAREEREREPQTVEVQGNGCESTKWHFYEWLAQMKAIRILTEVYKLPTFPIKLVKYGKSLKRKVEMTGRNTGY